jgi:hypothetical protein
MKKGFISIGIVLLSGLMVSCVPSQTSRFDRTYLEAGDSLPQDQYFVKRNEKWKLDVILPKTGEKVTYILDFISDTEWINTFIGSPVEESICCVTNRAISGGLQAQTESFANREYGFFGVYVYLDPKILLKPNSFIRNAKALICYLDGSSGKGPYKGDLFVGTDLEDGALTRKEKELGSCEFTQVLNP